MEKDKIEIIYQLVMNDFTITYDLLHQKGFTEEEIKELTLKKYIIPINSNQYMLGSIEKMRRYGVYLLLSQRTREANICFRKCYELAPNSKNICLQFLLAAVKRYDYQEAFKIYANLEKIIPEKNSKNNNLYLYLLSVITECPEEYKKKLSDLNYNDLILPPVYGNKIENNIRKAIIQSKYTYALQLINLHISDREYSVKYELIKALLNQAIDCDRIHKNNLLILAKEEKYTEILNILKERQQLRVLGTLETYILLITDAIDNLLKTNIIPTPTVTTTHKMYDALIGNNYQLALEIDNHHHEHINESAENDIVNILLVKLNNLIKTIKEQNEEETKKDTSDEVIQEVQTINDSYQQKIKETEELAYYFKTTNLTLEQAQKKIGILTEQILLIKLIYARDCYIEGNYELGDQYIKEVEESKIQNDTISSFLTEIKLNKAQYANQTTNHIKKREYK